MAFPQAKVPLPCCNAWEFLYLNASVREGRAERLGLKKNFDPVSILFSPCVSRIGVVSVPSFGLLAIF